MPPRFRVPEALVVGPGGARGVVGIATAGDPYNAVRARAKGTNYYLTSRVGHAAPAPSRRPRASRFTLHASRFTPHVFFFLG